MKQIIANLTAKGYKQKDTTMAALTNFWKAGARASGFLNRKNQSSPVYSSSVPSRINSPEKLRVSFIMKTTMKDGGTKEFYFNEFDDLINVTKGELDENAYQYAMNIVGSHYEIELAYITYTSVVAI